MSGQEKKSQFSKILLSTLELMKIVVIVFFSFGVAISGEVFIGYGPVSFYFLSFIVMGISLKISKNWSYNKFFIIALLLFLVWLLLKFYIFSSAGE